MALTAENITVGAGSIAFQYFSDTVVSVAVEASPAPTTTAFAVSAADAAKLKVGDRMTSSATPAYDGTEAAAAPVITDISDDANPVITVSPAFASAPSTTAYVLWHDMGATDGGIEMNADLVSSRMKNRVILIIRRGFAQRNARLRGSEMATGEGMPPIGHPLPGHRLNRSTPRQAPAALTLSASASCAASPSPPIDRGLPWRGTSRRQSRSLRRGA